MTPTTRDFSLKSTTILASILAAASLAACGDDGPAGPDDGPPPPVPVVNSVDPTTVSPGDTVHISGSNFAMPHEGNTVYFYNPHNPATPIDGSGNSLTVIVPGDAATGPVRVTVARQPAAGVGPEVHVQREVGEVWVFGGTGSNYDLTLPFADQNTEYLLIPNAANAAIPYTAVNPYSISSTGTGSPNAMLAAGPAGAGTARMTVKERFDAHLRENLEAILASGDESALARRPDVALTKSPQAPAQLRQFNVLHTAVGDPRLASSYTPVTARLRYEGQWGLIYVDTLKGGTLSQSDYDDFGQQFDSQIFPTDTLYFGRESDIDGNGKVIILVSGIVNGLAATDPGWDGTYFIGGFFLAVDLFRPGQSGIQTGTTNQAEIFYVLASDPAGEYLPGYSFSEAFVRAENPATIAHEFQHLISFSYRFRNYGFAGAQTTWLEEGMSHTAEFFNDLHDSNRRRANDYLDDPGAISLEHGSAPINQRGGIFLFLRYLGDRFGDDIYKDILHSSCLGRSCIEAITGENFYDTVADFLATLYLSQKGITIDDRYNYTSIDLRDYDPVKIADELINGPDVSGTIVRTSGDFYRFTSPSHANGVFTFNQSTNIGLRTLIVRTQ